MSELKYQLMLNKDMSWVPCYLKSEADKVIAELKAQKDAKILALDAEVFKQKHHAKLFFDERNYAETQLRRQKYKRCLAMAKWCEEAYNRECGLNPEEMTNKEFYKQQTEFWPRWNSKWIKIAEQFKEAK